MTRRVDRLVELYTAVFLAVALATGLAWAVYRETGRAAVQVEER